MMSIAQQCMEDFKENNTKKIDKKISFNFFLL